MNEILFKKLPFNIFDYKTFKNLFSDLKFPKNKVASLIADGEIIQLKKGIYTLNPDIYGIPYSREIISNILYGPSHISLEYGLSFYGLIPERVNTVTAVCVGNNKIFKNSTGVYTFRNIPVSIFSEGIDKIYLDEKKGFLIANKERCLCDTLIFRKNNPINSINSMEKFLIENLRIEPVDLVNFNIDFLINLSDKSKSRKLKFLIQYLLKLKKDF
ncbi:MAG: hypothetical protein WC002_01920, partial [Candidatus Muiribacteriota bacterium]